MYRHMFMVLCGMIAVIVIFVYQTKIKSLILHDISGHWAEPNIQYLVDEGILMGYPDQTFRPNAPITRAEAAMMVSLLQESKHGTSSVSKTVLGTASSTINVLRIYRDQNTIPVWAREAIVDVTERGIMKGDTDHAFRPNDFLSRHEAFLIIGEYTHNPAIPHHLEMNTVDLYITRAEFCSLILESNN